MPNHLEILKVRKRESKLILNQANDRQIFYESIEEQM